MNKKIFLLVPTLGMLLIGCASAGTIGGGGDSQDSATSAPIQEKYETLELSDTNINAFLNTFDNVKVLKNFAQSFVNIEETSRNVPDKNGKLAEAKNVMKTSMEMGILTNGAYAVSGAEVFMKQGEQTVNVDFTVKEFITFGEKIEYVVQSEEHAPEGMEGNGPIAPGNYKRVAEEKTYGIPYMDLARTSFDEGRKEAAKHTSGAGMDKENVKRMFDQAKSENSNFLDFKFEKSNIGNSKYRVSYSMNDNDEDSDTTLSFNIVFDGGIVFENSLNKVSKDFILKEDQTTKEYVATRKTTTSVLITEKADDEAVVLPVCTNYKELTGNSSNELLLSALLPNASTSYDYGYIDYDTPVQQLQFKEGLAEIKAAIKTEPLDNVRSHVKETFSYKENVDEKPQKYEMTVLHDINLYNNELTNNGVVMVLEEIKNAQEKMECNERISSYKEYLYKDGNAYTYASENIADMFNDADYEIFTGNATNKKGKFVIKDIDANTITTNIGENGLLHPEIILDSVITYLSTCDGKGIYIGKRGNNRYEISYSEPTSKEGQIADIKVTIVDGRLKSYTKDDNARERELTTLPNGLEINGDTMFRQEIVFEEAKEIVKPNVTGYSEIKDASATKFNLYNIAMNMM